MAKRGPYIDVRGVYPVYVDGLKAIELASYTRAVTVEDITYEIMEFNTTIGE